MAWLGNAASDLDYEAGIDATLDALAAHMASHVAINALWDIADNALSRD